MKVCAEIGQVPGANLDFAKMLVQDAAHYGADAVKVQALRPDKIVVPNVPAYWEGADTDQRTAFDRAGYLSVEDVWRLRDYAHDRSMAFVVTPFDLDEGIDSCKGADFIKIASGDIRYRQLIEAAAKIGVPLIVSTGASVWPEIRDVLDWTAPFKVDLIVLACTLDYPTAMVDANLGRIRTLQSMVAMTRTSRSAADPRKIEVGYSDHTSNRHISFACGVLGCVWLEVHYAGALKTDPGRQLAVRDTDFALDNIGLQYYVADGQIGVKVKGDGRLLPMLQELDARVGARRGLYAARTIKRGEILESSDIAILRPGNGLEPIDVADLVGRPAWNDFKKGDSLADDRQS